MWNKKRLFTAIVLFLLVICTPVYHFFLRPATFTVRGTLPPGIHIEAVTDFYTKSSFCRDFSFGSGSFTGSGSSIKITEATADASGWFELEVPVEKKSLWCDWIYKGIYLSAISPPPQKGYSPRSIDLGVISGDETAISTPVTIQCAKTYHVFSRADGTTGKRDNILCRNTNMPFPEDASEILYWPDIPVPPDAKELTLHMLLETGPEYDLNKGPAYYWRVFDAARP